MSIRLGGIWTVAAFALGFLFRLFVCLFACFWLFVVVVVCLVEWSFCFLFFVFVLFFLTSGMFSRESMRRSNLNEIWIFGLFRLVSICVAFFWFCLLCLVCLLFCFYFCFLSSFFLWQGVGNDEDGDLLKQQPQNIKKNRSDSCSTSFKS